MASRTARRAEAAVILTTVLRRSCQDCLHRSDSPLGTARSSPSPARHPSTLRTQTSHGRASSTNMPPMERLPRRRRTIARWRVARRVLPQPRPWTRTLAAPPCKPLATSRSRRRSAAAPDRSAPAGRAKLRAPSKKGRRPPPRRRLLHIPNPALILSPTRPSEGMLGADGERPRYAEPATTSPHAALQPAEREAFERDGFVILRNLVPQDECRRFLWQVGRRRATSRSQPRLYPPLPALTCTCPCR